jgi:hypothetical protein
MQVLWWLVPPLVATMLAMIWAAWGGRHRDEVRRDDSDAALAQMRSALARPVPQSRHRPAAHVVEPSHGVAVRRSASPSAATSRSR